MVAIKYYPVSSKKPQDDNNNSLKKDTILGKRAYYYYINFGDFDIGKGEEDNLFKEDNLSFMWPSVEKHSNLHRGPSDVAARILLSGQRRHGSSAQSNYAR